MRINHLTTIVLVCFFLGAPLLISGCSSTPSQSDAKQIIQQRIDKLSGGRIKLISFEKTNGQEGQLLGVKLYSLEYACVIEFLEDCKWIPEFRTAKLTKSQDFWEKFREDLNNMGRQSRPVKKGEKAKVAGQIVFEKTEKGWREAKM